MHTYKLDTINYKDGEFHVRFVPNSEPIEFVVSGQNTEKLFDALKTNGYKFDKMQINTCLKKYGHNSDKIAINGNWLNCKFESISEHDEKGPSIVRRIKMGAYDGKPLYWVYLGHYDDETDLFLSEDIICNRRFDSESNDWHNSELAKWLAVEFTEEAFFSSEYCQLVPLKCTDKGKFGYKLFLLSEAEYIEYRNEIPNVDCRWWLRSQGFSTDYAEYVYGSGSICSDGCRVDYNECGVRPALRLRRVDRVISLRNSVF